MIDRRFVGSAVVMMMIGLFLGGPYIGTAGCLIGAVQAVRPKVVLWAAGIGPLVLLVLTVWEGSTDSETVADFATSRPIAHHAGLLVIVLWLSAARIVWAKSEQIRTLNSTGS